MAETLRWLQLKSLAKNALDDYDYPVVHFTQHMESMMFIKYTSSTFSAALIASLIALPAVAAPPKTTVEHSVSVQGEGSSPYSFAEDLKRAQKGDPNAQSDVAMRYAAGADGAPQDFRQAKMWFEKAAAQGNESAKDNLNYLHQKGLAK